MQFGSLTLKRCRYGWMLFSGPFIGECFNLYGEYSESEVAMMRRFVRPGDTVVDIGANIGSLTIPLAQMVGTEGRVHAVELHADNFNVLCANLALNQIGHVYPVNAFMRMSDAIPMQPPYVRTDRPVPTVTLDALALDACRFIKIDVDGNELDVLKSGARTIETLRPILYLENDVRGASQNLLAYLLGLNYRLYWHVAPIFAADNFFGNRENRWHPNGIVSLMVLCLPKEHGLAMNGLKEILTPEEWWDGKE